MSAYDGNYKKARSSAFLRSGGVCQFCGYENATDAHHWARKYPDGIDCASDDLVALCWPCHQIATTIRRYRRRGVGWPHLLASVLKGVANCATKSSSQGKPPCSSTTSKQAWTPSVPSLLNSGKSRRSGVAQHGLNSTESSNSNLLDLNISITKGGPQSRQDACAAASKREQGRQRMEEKCEPACLSRAPDSNLMRSSP